METIGLIAAAGQATRLSPLPGSKELFPIGFEPHPETGEPHPKPVSKYLLELMREAGARQVYLVIRKGKWDIPQYYGDGSQLCMHLAYLIMNQPYGPPFSLDQAYTFAKDKTVVFGFPDILISPPDALKTMLAKLQATQADVVLGAFPVQQPHKWDMLEFGEDGAVKHIYPKPKQSKLRYGWALACWKPAFTEFMHQHLQQVLAWKNKPDKAFELSVGAVIQAAIDNGLQVQSVCFDSGTSLDTGTPEDLQAAIRNYS
ncbi:nucleotidyltransferase family protein [Pontibacter ramchanderi]|uniref:glucose-1-phosphate thymidylyltransferase n=1 Tax=Pontibacter ramchanderi TaxID=1179743 RepID=A0A2N3V3F5_9BACT|nr:sugar phosphate nucleotidyltransferase [Pontibacter ramchanderi]PKV76165.1 glucose-1-phosphate thymidylyltransferase [Pontibacter ramchanderi]